MLNELTCLMACGQLQHIDCVHNAVQEYEGRIAALSTRLEEEQQGKTAAAEVSAS